MKVAASEFLAQVRCEELDIVLGRFYERFAGKDVLELGSGPGIQLARLRSVCKSATGVDVPDGPYMHQSDVIEYDGARLPFADQSFDVVFSSHVLEHLTNDALTHSEMRRVLRPGGCSIHVVPTHWARIYNFLAHYPATAKRLLARRENGTPGNGHAATYPTRPLSAKIIDVLFLPRHGEYGNRFTELGLMTPDAWRRRLSGGRLDHSHEHLVQRLRVVEFAPQHDAPTQDAGIQHDTY